MKRAHSKANMLATGAIACALGGVFAVASMTGSPGQARASSDAVVIDITDPERSLYPIAIPVGVNSDPELAKLVAEVSRFNLQVSGWFNVLNPDSFLADLDAEGTSIVPRAWADVGAFGVTKYRAMRVGNRVRLQFRLYEVERGASPVLERVYSGDMGNVRDLVHQWSNEVVEHFTGEPGFFGSKLAFTANSRHGKRILVMDHDGHSVRSITRNRFINMLPSWSPGGDKVAFTSYMRNNPDLYVVGAGGGSPQRLSGHRGMNTGASWSPDGSRIALTLSKDGTPDIFVIDASSGQILTQLTRSPHINTSPAWSPDGREIAFVSNREGGPQIFVMNADGSNQRRVSHNGPYNTSPTWSPRQGERVLAYTTRDRGNFDIVTIDLKTREMVRITQGRGNNEEPAFAPSGRAIAFASRRPDGAGIYIANADGSGPAVRVWSGIGTSVTWGPVPN